MRAEYEKLIAERDVLLGDLRKQWMEAREPGERRKAMNKINDNLDERSRLMRCRDASPS